MQKNLPSFILGKPTSAAWKLVKAIPHHGFVVPLFSLKTRNSLGIGDFYDLLPMIDFCKEVGFSVIQLLPIKDTQNEQSPYNVVSSLALNPIYLSLSNLPYVDKDAPLKKKLKAFAKWERLKKLAYEKVRSEKLYWLNEYSKKYLQKLEKLSSFQKFVKDNPWLKEYALFLILKEKFNNSSWKSWPSEYKEIEPAFFDSLIKTHSQKIKFHYLLQYLCFMQMSLVKNKAKKKSVHLMGDIPIFVSIESADVFFHKHLFDLTHTAGAPPDAYNNEGQTWGFPIYNWEEMAKTDYSFWRRRIAYASNFYSIYRVDHIVGFFRIWATEESKKAIDGHFLPEKESCWLEHGKRLLEMLISSSPMLPIGEDLGNVPNMVRPCLETLGICGTKVIRWEKHWKNDKTFINPLTYSPLSLTTVSTHDSTTLRQWWKEEKEDAERFAKEFSIPYSKNLRDPQRKAILKISHQSSSLFHINLFSEYLALIPGFQTKNPEDERVNRPGIVDNVENWNYRIPKPLEEIQKQSELKKFLKTLSS